MNGCTLCPRKCKADRESSVGFCGVDSRIKIARADAHMWEEPCISGSRGSGTVFFSGCNLGCIFCQNYEISSGRGGRHVTEDELCDIVLSLQEKGVHNINFVTPTHYTDAILRVLDRIKHKLSVPVVWNTGGYERVETVERLSGYVDIFLPDMKYVNPLVSQRYSGASDYFENASRALFKMFEIAGYPQFDKDGMMTRGVLVRHLVLPSNIKESFAVLDFLAKSFDKERLYVSIMRQYFPCHRAGEFPEIARKLTSLEYQRVTEYARGLGITNGFLQKKDCADAKYVPPFEL